VNALALAIIYGLPLRVRAVLDVTRQLDAWNVPDVCMHQSEHQIDYLLLA
jgi:hypothetical protein